MLKGKKKEMAVKVKEQLAKCADIAITHDGWTSIAQESFQTITAHFINNEWEMKSVVLQTRKLTGSHTGEAIAESLQITAQEWSLPGNPIAVTDNAANEVRAFNTVPVIKQEKVDQTDEPPLLVSYI
jgi:hypothetical protein